jgi:hypothetical protein
VTLRAPVDAYAATPPTSAKPSDHAETTKNARALSTILLLKRTAALESNSISWATARQTYAGAHRARRALEPRGFYPRAAVVQLAHAAQADRREILV